MFAISMRPAAVVCLLLSTSAAFADGKIDPAALKKAKAATVYIKVTGADGDTSEGSGFATRLKGMIVTNAHVVGMLDNDSQKPAKIEVTFNSGEPNAKTYTAGVGYVDGESDLALLSVPSKSIPDYPDLLKIGLSQNLSETQDVFIIGFPLGKKAGSNVTVTATTVTSLRKEGRNIKHVQVNGGMHPGNSGGPLIDKDGNLVGIAVSAFAGTQVHLAIPTEVLNSVLNGRIMNSNYHVPYRDGDKIHVPLEFDKADPLGNMKTISVETWIGKPGPIRPSASGKAPEPLEGDSAVVLHEFKADEKGHFTGELLLDNKSDPKSAYWLRYKLNRGGESFSWYPAAVLSSSRLSTPVDRKAAVIKYEPPTDKADRLQLTSEATFRVRDTEGDQALTMEIRGSANEKVTDHLKSGSWRKKIDFSVLESTASVDKKPIDSPQLTAALKNANKIAEELEIAANGTVTKNLPDLSKVPVESRPTLSLISEQVQQSFDSLAVPLPGKSIEALATWKGDQTYMLGALGISLPAKSNVTYTYEGSYTRGNQTVAVITFTGPLEAALVAKPKRGAKPPKIVGNVSGKVEVAADTGIILSGTEKIRAEASFEKEGKPLKAIGLLNVTLLRNPAAPPKNN